MTSVPPHLRHRVQRLLEAENTPALLTGIHEALQGYPRDPWLLHLGAIHEGSVGNYKAALDLFVRALHVTPEDPQVHYNCGTLLQQLGEHELARTHLERSVQLKPDYPQALSNLGGLLRDLGELDAALVYLAKAVELQPENINSASNLATVLRDVGRLEESLALYDAAIQASSAESPITESNRLLAYNYSAAIDDQSLCRQHLEWSQKWDSLTRLTPPVRPSRGQGEKIRVGYVSADFHQHSVAFFLEGILESHDRDRFQIYGYSTNRRSDQVTLRLQALCDEWVDVFELDDAAAAQQIVSDEIDVLVDLTGHTAHNRLGVFARKPAPVQMTYLGYGTTTGLAEMDYRITDAIADPPEIPWHGSEELVRLPSGFQGYLPSAQLPVPGPPPSLSSDGVTFASFNILPKQGPAVLQHWATILRDLPGSRLMLKTKQLASGLARRYVLDVFAQQGISAERLLLRSYVASFEEHIKLYQQVDIGLDPFPYNGATTTCEALTMGVPVITLRGDRHVARVGASILTRVGLADLVAEDLDEYRQIALTLASNVDHRQAIRASLRATMMSSPLTDTATLTHELEAVFAEKLRVAQRR